MAEDAPHTSRDARRRSTTGSSAKKLEADFVNALFVLMCVVAVIAVIFGLTADTSAKPDWALRDNRIYRGEIGLATFLILYTAVIVLWLAAHKLTLKSLSAGPASAEIPQATQEVEDSAVLIEKLSTQVETISNSTSEELAYHDVRLQRIENSTLGRLLPGNVPPPPRPPTGAGQAAEAGAPPEEDAS
jgi:hypothetical protein